MIDTSGSFTRRKPMRIPKPPPAWMEMTFSDPQRALAFMERASKPEIADFVRMANYQYLHWQKLRYHPVPEGMTPQEMWAAVCLSRSTQFQMIDLSFSEGRNFRYWTPPHHQEWLHRIDQDAGGFIGSRSQIVPRDDDDRFLFNSLMEEAISSSQLEGAATTREAAKQMLRTGRRPRTHHEKMILNNYRAILEIRELKHATLTPEMLLHLQEVMTEGTLADPSQSGRFRTVDENVCVVDTLTGDVLHKPPSANQLDWRIDELCDFANEKPKNFIHPAVKAIILHFALGYIHPFAEGNGRTARAIFYWYMLRNGYWIFEYLPISRIVLDSPAQYGMAYLYSETDGGDLTYFIHYHLRVIDRAVREMHAYFARQQQRMREAREAVENIPGLNHRQMALAYDAIQNPHATYTIRQHAGTHAITNATAREDLFGLEASGIFQKQMNGRRWVFTPTMHLRKRVQKGAFRQRPEPRHHLTVTVAGDPSERIESLPNQRDLFHTESNRDA